MFLDPVSSIATSSFPLRNRRVTQGAPPGALVNVASLGRIGARDLSDPEQHKEMVFKTKRDTDRLTLLIRFGIRHFDPETFDSIFALEVIGGGLKSMVVADAKKICERGYAKSPQKIALRLPKSEPTLGKYPGAS